MSYVYHYWRLTSYWNNGSRRVAKFLIIVTIKEDFPKITYVTMLFSVLFFYLEINTYGILSWGKIDTHGVCNDKQIFPFLSCFYTGTSFHNFIDNILLQQWEGKVGNKHYLH